MYPKLYSYTQKCMLTAFYFTKLINVKMLLCTIIYIIPSTLNRCFPKVNTTFIFVRFFFFYHKLLIIHLRSCLFVKFVERISSTTLNTILLKKEVLSFLNKEKKSWIGPYL